jgi:hypothetical protein
MVSDLRVLARTRSLYGAEDQLTSRCPYEEIDCCDAHSTSAVGQFLPKSDVCVMSVQLPNNGLKLDVAALRIWANSGLMHCSKERRYSIISSAAVNNLSGMVSPSALAVLRLMISSYFVGTCTGRSAGFSPLRTRSIYPAARRNCSLRTSP